MVRKFSGLFMIPILAVTFGTANFARAGFTTYTLQDLLNGQSIQIGDKTFAHFNNFSCMTMGGAHDVDPAQIIVSPTTGGGKFGLIFSGKSEFRVLQDQWQTTHFEFDVIAQPTNPMTGAFLRFNGSYQCGGSIIPEGLSLPTENGDNWIYRPTETPMTLIHFSQDIMLDGHQGLSTVDAVEIYFSSEAPEPPTVILLTPGLCGFVCFRWKKALNHWCNSYQ